MTSNKIIQNLVLFFFWKNCSLSLPSANQTLCSTKCIVVNFILLSRSNEIQHKIACVVWWDPWRERLKLREKCRVGKLVSERGNTRRRESSVRRECIDEWDSGDMGIQSRISLGQWWYGNPITFSVILSLGLYHCASMTTQFTLQKLSSDSATCPVLLC